ncbi:hypothetical protein CUR178_02596 [Leishmania enriettii]|uniref:Uncharacterized protein n=1 Tax=Leishmania enriettii TaxID=5663 RepID=A0A836GBN1_LEIEN|nr:hypothetical protein CUR178_02596 [Leishmania enriettii]
MNPLEHHTSRTPTELHRSSVPFSPPAGVLQARMTQSVSPDPTATSQDSPAHIGSFATSFFGSTGTSLITVPPAPPHQEVPLQLCRNSGLRSIWSPQQVSRVFQCPPLAHADSLADTEMLSRGSFVKNEEEARVEELLDGRGSLIADLAGVAAPPLPREMKCLAAAEETESPVSRSGTIGPLGVGGRPSFAQHSVFPEAVVKDATTTTAVTTEAPRRGTQPPLASPMKSLDVQGAAMRSTTLERRAATGTFNRVGMLGATEMHAPHVLTRGGPSTSSPTTLQHTSTSTSRRPTVDSVYATPLPFPRPPLHTQPPQQLCVLSGSWDALATPAHSSRAALGAKQLPPIMTFPVFDPTVRTSAADTSPRNIRQASGAPQSLYCESADNSASSPVTVHVETPVSCPLSPSVSNPRTGAVNVGELSAVPSLLHVSRLGSSGLLAPLASRSASVALLSAKEEVQPSPSASHVPPNGRPSQRSMPPSTPRPAFITRTHSAALSASAPPYSPMSLTPLALPIFTPAAQLCPAGATRAYRGRQYGVQSPLQAIWLRSEGLAGPSESTLSAKGSNEADTPVLNSAFTSPAVVARTAGALLGSLSQRYSQRNVHELSSSIPSHDAPTMSGADAVVPGNAVPQTGPQLVGERERRSVMQRIFREPKKGGQRAWVSITAPESLSSSADASAKS